MEAVIVKYYSSIPFCLTVQDTFLAFSRVTRRKMQVLMNMCISVYRELSISFAMFTSRKDTLVSNTVCVNFIVG